MPEPGLTWGAIDQLNSQTIQASRPRSFTNVRAEFDATYQELVDQVEDLPENVARDPVVGELISWRYKHYQRHAAEVSSWLESEVNRVHDPPDVDEVAG